MLQEKGKAAESCNGTESTGFWEHLPESFPLSEQTRCSGRDWHLQQKILFSTSNNNELLGLGKFQLESFGFISLFLDFIHITNTYLYLSLWRLLHGYCWIYGDGFCHPSRALLTLFTASVCGWGHLSGTQRHSCCVARGLLGVHVFFFFFFLTLHSEFKHSQLGGEYSFSPVFWLQIYEKSRFLKLDESILRDS